MKLLDPKLKIDPDWSEYEDNIEGLAETLYATMLLEHDNCKYFIEPYFDGIAFRVNYNGFSVDVPIHDDIYSTALELLTYAKYHDGTPIYETFFKNQTNQSITFIDVKPDFRRSK